MTARLSERLRAGGGVEVVEPEAVAQRLGDGVAQSFGDAELRLVAQQVGANYVVAGSLTELAGSFSLDVRLSPAEVTAASATRVVTARGEEELFQKVNELAEWIAERVGSAQPLLIAEVDVRGGEGLSPELLEQLRTRVGEFYDPELVREDLERLRGSTEVGSASVTTARGPEGLRVQFEVVPAERIAGTTAPADLPVAEVRIQGNRRIESDAIRVRVGTRAGDPYLSGQVAEDVRAIYALGFFRNVRVLTEAGPDGLIVTYVVEENPVVRRISISGNDNIDAEKIRDALTLTTGSTLDYPLLFENEQRIEALYRAEGYYLAEVSYEVEPIAEGSVEIHFEVKEKNKLRLRAIRFNGNEFLTDAELQEDFRTKTWKLWSYATSWFDRSGTYSEPVFIQDLRGVEKKYTDAGFLQVEVEEPEVTPSPDGLTVTVQIVEGDRFRVGTIELEGDPTVDIDALRQDLQLKQNEIFNRSHLTEDVQELTSQYTNRGYYFASVNPRTALSEETREVDVVFEVERGPLYFVRQVNISGNTTTRDSVIRREVQVVEGQLYSQRAIQVSQARIQRTGYFEDVSFETRPTDDPTLIDLDVNVVERPTGSFSFGAGFSSQDNFVFTASLAQSNLFGRGYAVNFTADLGGSTNRFFLSASDPYFLDSNFSLGVTGFLTQVRFEDFDQDQIGFDLVAGHPLNEENTARGFLRYSFASRELDESSNVNAASLIFRQILATSPETTSLLGLSFRTDTRDDRLAPTSGSQYAGALEVAGLGGFSRFVRLEGRASWYFGAPWFWDRSTFVVSARAGYTLPLNSISDYDVSVSQAFAGSSDGEAKALLDIDDDLKLPLTERYFLGGLGSFQLRGYKARSVGPRRSVLRRGGLFGTGDAFMAVGRELDEDPIPDPPALIAPCRDTPDRPDLQGNRNGRCNSLSDQDDSDFDDLDETDVIGGNSFVSNSFEYRFPISEAIGLQGLVFLDMGNAFAENETERLFDPTEWRYGTGVGVQWFSPFGPLMVIWGIPINPLSVEDKSVFEFSVGGLGL